MARSNGASGTASRASLTEAREALSRALAIVDAEQAAPSPALPNLLTAVAEIQAAIAQIGHFADADPSSSARILTEAKEAVLRAMRDRFGGRPELRRYLRVTGFSAVHGVLLDYVAARPAEWVGAEIVRALTGGQSNAERRLRDLRDLGFTIEWDKASNRYRLASREQDVAAAARRQAALRIHANKALSPKEQDALEASLDGQLR